MIFLGASLLAVCGLGLLGSLGSPARGSAGTTAMARPAGAPSRPEPPPRVVARRAGLGPPAVADYAYIPARSNLRAGDVVDLVDDSGREVVSIIAADRFFHLPNPTRVRVTQGEPRRWKILGGLYEVEVLEGEHRGQRGLTDPSLMRGVEPDAATKAEPSGVKIAGPGRRPGREGSRSRDRD